MLNLPMLLGAFQPPGSPRLTPCANLEWKMITVPKKITVTINCVSSRILLSGFGG